jgi:hypothetical protein
MRGTKAKQARRIMSALSEGETRGEATGYKQAPWGQIFSLGGRHFYQHIKRTLKGQGGEHRHTTMRQATRAGVRLEQHGPTS